MPSAGWRLNVDLLNKEGSESHEFLILLRSFDLYCTNYSPTRSNAWLDNVYTNLTSDHYDVSLLDQDIMPDHAGEWVLYRTVCVWEYGCRPNSNNVPKKTKRVISDDRIGNFRNCLSFVDWPSLYKIVDNSIAFTFLINVISFWFIDHCPVTIVKPTIDKNRPFRGSSHKVWFTLQLGIVTQFLTFVVW